MIGRLPVIDSCDDCGACCMRTPVPPFEPGEETVRSVPAALLQPAHDRIAADQHFDPLPCVWFDETARACRHYDLRPAACRRFEVGTDACRMARREVGIDL